MLKKIIKLIKSNIKILIEIFKTSKKSKVKILKEIINYKKKYQINIEDYLSFQFFNMNDNEVSTFFTYHMNNKLIKKSNENSKKYIFKDKELFNIIFNEYLGREWIVNKNISYQEFQDFVKDKDYLFYKKIDGSRGIGAEKINVKDYNGNIKKLYDYIKKLDKGIIEEHIVAHKDINKICDSGLSTIRIVTLNKNGKCKVLESVFMLTNGSVVNCEVTGGGLSACINIDTGIVETDGVDVKRNFYEMHPISKEKIIGFKVPYWNEVIELINKIYNKVPGINYIGWDIAITDRGPIVIEGNASWPSHRIWQVPYLREKKGKRKEIEEKINND